MPGTGTSIGPLAGVRVLELAGIGPAPLAAMLLADLGAEVVQIDRVGGTTGSLPGVEGPDHVRRRRRMVGVDIRTPEGRDLVLDLVARSDVLIEGFRPGTTERLGLGPDAALARNPDLVYARMTGWGQDGPLAQRAGHDLNYTAVTGALFATGRPETPPPPPLNLVADYGGGTMFLVVGVLAALHAVRAGTARGQVVDAAMVDGAALLTTMFHSLRAAGAWSDERASNLLDGGAPFYDTYRTSDDRFITIAALEPKFYAELVRLSGFDDGSPDHGPAAQYRADLWPRHRERWTELLAGRTRGEWEQVFAGSDACAFAVMDFAEAPRHPHLAARRTFVEVDGVPLPTPAPRFSATPLPDPVAPDEPGSATDAVLAELGVAPERIAELRAAGVVG